LARLKIGVSKNLVIHYGVLVDDALASVSRTADLAVLTRTMIDRHKKAGRPSQRPAFA